MVAHSNYVPNSRKENFAKGRDLEWKCTFFPREVLNNNDINTYEKWPFIGKEKRSRQETLNAKS